MSEPGRICTYTMNSGSTGSARGDVSPLATRYPLEKPALGSWLILIVRCYSATGSFAGSTRVTLQHRLPWSTEQFG